MAQVLPFDTSQPKNSKGVSLDSTQAADTKPDATDNAMPVYASLNVISLFQVDTVAETFKVRLRIVMAWPVEFEASLFGQDDENEVMHLVRGMGDADRDWEPTWYPRYGIRNKIESSEQVENFETVFVGNSRCLTEAEWKDAISQRTVTKKDFWTTRETSCNVVINSREDLRCFPFDIQEMMVSIRMEHDVSLIQVEGMDKLPQQVRKRVPKHLVIPARPFTLNFNNLDTAEHEVYRKLPCYTMLTNNFMNRAREHHCGSLLVGIVMQRHMGHYVYNVFLMVFCITSLMLVPWAFCYNQLDERFSVDFTLLLTGQAFKLVIADKLPKVNYLTAVDIYCIWCFLFMALGIVFHTVVGWHEDGDLEDNPQVDKVLGYVWLGCWILFNLTFIILCVVLHKRQRWELQSSAIDAGFTIQRMEDVRIKPKECARTNSKLE